jgi:ABC-type thiamine transport system ATPase subunit
VSRDDGVTERVEAMETLGLELNGLVWSAGGWPRTLRPSPLVAEAMNVTVVVARNAAEARSFTDVILGLKLPDKGWILLGGREITMVTEPEMRDIGFVPAGGGLSPALSIEQNIAFGLRKRPALRRHHVRFVADRLHLTGDLRLRPADLPPSGRLRAAVARAMCHRRHPQAIVIEEHSGSPLCEVAIGAVRDYGELPILVVCDRADRGRTLASPAEPYEVIDADET